MTAARSDPDALLDVKEVAARYRVHTRSVYRWIADGRLRALKIGGLRRVRRADLEAFEREGPAG